MADDDDDDGKNDKFEREVTLTRLPDSTLAIGNNNAIGVYGDCVASVKFAIERKQAPIDLFDEVSQEVLQDLQLDVFPRFVKSAYYRKYIRTKWMETKPVQLEDFKQLRLLGRGGFGTVSAYRKENSGAIYAIKGIHKRLVKAKDALANIMTERDVLTMINSRFVTNSKYAFQTEETLYLVMDLLIGGDLKYHLINENFFSENRARFYAAEVLLGLEHLHSLHIIYRDLKLENVLLDDKGHAYVTDLGLAVHSEKPIQGYAGTPGYTAPEMIENRYYGPEADLFSFGVLIYRMMCGNKPFNGRDMDQAVLKKRPEYPAEFFSKNAKSLISGLLEKDPKKRLGNGPRGTEEIKEHPFFASIDWGLLEAGYLDPPWIPGQDGAIAAPSEAEIGEFDMREFAQYQLSEAFKRTVRRFDFVSPTAVQQEMANVLMRADAGVNQGIFDQTATAQKKPPPQVPMSPKSKAGRSTAHLDQAPAAPEPAAKSDSSCCSVQ